MADPAVHPPRFLVLRGGAIGDFIVTLPVLQALRDRWPDAYVEIWGYPHVARLALASGLAQRVVSLDRAEMARFYVPVMDVTPELERQIRSFDIVFNYLHDPEGQIRSNLLLAGARQVLSGSPIVKRGEATRFLLEPLMDLALYDSPDTPVLDLPPAPHLLGGAASPVVAVHPGSGGEKKKWPLSNFFALADALRDAGAAVVWVLGEADDRERAALAAAARPEPRLDSLDLVDLAGALAACDAYVGNDAGITHLAAAVGTPTIAVFGPSDASVWAPKGRGGVRVVQAPGGDLAALPIAEVAAAALALLPSR